MPTISSLPELSPRRRYPQCFPRGDTRLAQNKLWRVFFCDKCGTEKRYDRTRGYTDGQFGDRSWKGVIPASDRYEQWVTNGLDMRWYCTTCWIKHWRTQGLECSVHDARVKLDLFKRGEKRATRSNGESPPPKKLAARSDDSQGNRSCERPLGQGKDANESLKSASPARKEGPPWRDQNSWCFSASVRSDPGGYPHAMLFFSNDEVPDPKEEVVSSPTASDFDWERYALLDHPLTARRVLALCAFIGDTETRRRAADFASVVAYLEHALSEA